MRQLIERIHAAERRLLPASMTTAHLCYFGLVTVQAEHGYRYAALACGVLVILSIVQRMPEGRE